MMDVRSEERFLRERIEYAFVPVQMWNTFDRKTRMCKTVQELIEQAKWLVGQFKPNIFKSRWLTGAQVEWIEECARAEDFKHCGSLPFLMPGALRLILYCSDLQCVFAYIFPWLTFFR